MNNKRIVVRVCDYEYECLLNIAKNNHTTLSKLIRQCIDLMINGQSVNLQDVIKEIRIR